MLQGESVVQRLSACDAQAGSSALRQREVVLRLLRAEALGAGSREAPPRVRRTGRQRRGGGGAHVSSPPRK